MRFANNEKINGKKNYNLNISELCSTSVSSQQLVCCSREEYLRLRLFFPFLLQNFGCTKFSYSAFNMQKAASPDTRVDGSCPAGRGRNIFRAGKCLFFCECFCKVLELISVKRSEKYNYFGKAVRKI